MQYISDCGHILIYITVAVIKQRRNMRVYKYINNYCYVYAHYI